MLIANVVMPVSAGRRWIEVLGRPIKLEEPTDLLGKSAFVNHGQLAVVPRRALLAEGQQLLGVSAFEEVQKPFPFVAQLGGQARRRTHRVHLRVHLGRECLLLHEELRENALFAQGLLPERHESLQL